MAVEKGRETFDTLPAWANSSVYSLDDLCGPDDRVARASSLVDRPLRKPIRRPPHEKVVLFERAREKGVGHAMKWNDPMEIQAVAAIVLIIVTGVYVWLTHNLSKTSAHQLRLLRESQFHLRRSDLIALASLARRLLKSLEELPVTKADHNASGRLLTASLWNPEEARDLGLLSAKSGQDFAHMAEQAAVDLQWMLERIAPVRSEPRHQGFEVDRFPWSDHSNRINRAKTALTEIADKASADAKALG